MNIDKKVSVIMGIYNCEADLEQSIKSIKNQSYENWELIMCDDGSRDNTFKIAKEHEKKSDGKIRVIKNDKNMGLAYSLNRCIEISTGDYIARQDSDDISEPKRFEKQVQILNEKKDLALVGCGVKLFDGKNIFKEIRAKEKPTNIDVIKSKSFVHGSVMMKKCIINSVGNYTVVDRTIRGQDLDLWCKLYSKGYRGENIQESLYIFKEDLSTQKRRKYKYRINEFQTKAKYFPKLGLSVNNYLYVIKPLAVGLIPSNIAIFIRRKM